MSPDALKTVDDWTNYYRKVAGITPVSINSTANDIAAYVIVSPHRLDERQMYGDEYEVLDEFLDEFVTERGARYFNFDDNEEIRQELDGQDSFKDVEHLNFEGSLIFSRYIAKYVE